MYVYIYIYIYIHIYIYVCMYVCIYIHFRLASLACPNIKENNFYEGAVTRLKLRDILRIAREYAF